MKKTTIYKGFYYKFSFKSVYFLDPFLVTIKRVHLFKFHLYSASAIGTKLHSQ